MKGFRQVVMDYKGRLGDFLYIGLVAQTSGLGPGNSLICGQGVGDQVSALVHYINDVCVIILDISDKVSRHDDQRNMEHT